MLDVQLFGLNAGGHHLTSLLFHVVNTLLLFLTLVRMTGASWRSAFVAALFALHPLHVESVAWVAERKDVLSTFFFLLTLWAYARYAEVRGNSKAGSQSVEWSSGRVVRRSAPTDHAPVTTDRRSRFTFHVSLYLRFSARLFRPRPDEQADARYAAVCAPPPRLLAPAAVSNSTLNTQTLKRSPLSSWRSFPSSPWRPLPAW